VSMLDELAGDAKDAVASSVEQLPARVVTGM
jgi:hypothetical protein